jgi:hypothetical protein
MRTLLSSKWKFVGILDNGFLFQKVELNLDHHLVLLTSAKLVDVESGAVFFFGQDVNGTPSVEPSFETQRRIASGDLKLIDGKLQQYSNCRLVLLKAE